MLLDKEFTATLQKISADPVTVRLEERI